MEYDRLIERLRNNRHPKGLKSQAATAIETLQIENKALRNAANGFKAENSMLQKIRPVELSGESARAFELALEVSRLHAENAEMEKQLNEFSEFLCHMTGNLLSKTNYTAQAMISAAEDYQQRVCDACDEDFLFPDLPIKQAPAGGRGGHLMVEVMQFIFRIFSIGLGRSSFYMLSAQKSP